MTLGVEHLQGDEVLREGIQIVNTVILKDKSTRYLFFLLSPSLLTNDVLR